MSNFNIEIAKGKGKYSMFSEGFQSLDEARDTLYNTEVEDNRKFRIVDSTGTVQERYNSVSLREAQSTETVEAEPETVEAEIAATADDYSADDETESEAMVPNYRVMESPVVSLKGMDVQESWEIAKDCVDYPVFVLPAFGYDEQENEMYRAEGHTNQGRYTEVFLVFTDKNRINERNIVATMTGRFTPVSTREVYEDLQECLSDHDHAPQFVYVSGDGGRQRLMIDLKDKDGLDGKVTLRLLVDTSVDGSRAHSMSMYAVDNETGIPIAAYGASHNLSNRHTTNAIQNAAYFGPALGTVIEAWDSEVIPMLAMLNDAEYDRNMALDAALQFAKDSGIAERHRKRIQEHTSIGNAPMTGYDIVKEVSSYVQEQEKSPEWAERIYGNMQNAIEKMIDKMKK